MIDLAVEAGAVGAVARLVGDVLLRAECRDEAGDIGLIKRILGQEVLGDRIEPGQRHPVARERVADPGAALLPRAHRIIDGKAPAAEAEITGQHLFVGHRPGLGLRRFLVVALRREEEEGPVLPAVQLRQDDGTADDKGQLVVAQRLGSLQPVEVTAVQQVLVEVAVLRRAVDLVGAALEHHAEHAASGPAELGGHASSDELDLLERVHRGLDVAVVRGAGADDRLLGADAVDSVVQRAVALAQREEGVEPGRVQARQVVEDVVGPHLHHRNPHEGLVLEDGAAGGRLGLEQRHGAGHRNRFGDGAELHLDIQARGLADAELDAFPHVGPEARGLNGHLILTRIEVRDVEPAGLVGFAGGGEVRLGVDNLDLGADDGGAGRVGDVSD